MKTIELLKKLVSIPSVFPEEKAIGDFIADYFNKLGFTVKKIPSGKNRNNIIASYGKAKNYLAFYGHMDTVPRDEESKYSPFKLTVEKNKAWGLGAEDMKGSIAAMMQAAAFAVKNNLPVKFIFGVDEENISKGAHDLVNSGILRDIGFIIVGESGQVVDLNKPFSVVYGRKGRTLYKLSVFGKKAHAAEQEKGKNAISDAARMINFINSINFPVHSLLGNTDIVIQSIHSETSSFSVPDFCEIQFSLLTTPSVKARNVEELITDFSEKNNIKIKLAKVERETPYGESYEIDKKNAFVKLLESEIFNPSSVKPIYTSSVADENIFANRLKIPVISIGPIGNGGHTKEEWVDISSLEKVEEIYKKIITLYNSA